MWSRTYRKTFKGLDLNEVWNIWTDINQWHRWQSDIEYAKLDGEFKAGSSFLLKPRGGPKVLIELVKVEENRLFTDLTRFPLAKMYGQHELNLKEDGLELVTTMSIEGPLAFLWKKLVAQGIADGMHEQTENLVDYLNNVSVS